MVDNDFTSEQARTAEDHYYAVRDLSMRVDALTETLRAIVGAGDPDAPEGVDYPKLFAAIADAKKVLDA